MNLKVKTWLILFGVLLVASSCKKESKPIEISPELYDASIDRVTEIMIHDIFSPPVASRIFVYPNIAAYEIIAQIDDKYQTLAGQLPELTPIPVLDTTQNINPQLSALIAHMILSKKLIFSEDRITTMQDSLYRVWKSTNEDQFEASKVYGTKVADHIAEWMNKDNYNQTRTMPKFTVNTEDPTRWQPTPPAYMDGIEPHWDDIRPFALDSADQFKPAPPPTFSMDQDSEFYKELKVVYDTGVRVTQAGDSSEEMEIAKFWDCNPYVSVTRGHLMFATKKISPGAHWIGIVKIANKKINSNFDDSVYAYTKTSIAIADAFISCWDEKYRSNLIRPETLINQHIDENWMPLLQTPPFPEYSSGHSVVSGAAAEVMTSIYGDNFAFDDDTETPFGLPIRSYTSFNQASSEAALSRLYGGIHYPFSIENGLAQGRDIGDLVIKKIKMKKSGALAVK